VISSVAGDRGKFSNYVYGATKGGLTVFLQGLRNRLFHKGVHVLTIKPGFVDTPMTAGIKKGLLFARPESVGAGIYKAINCRCNTVYLPKFWWMIMAIIKSIPEFIFKRLKL
jgi:short-subunit dehydrogenase